MTQANRIVQEIRTMPVLPDGVYRALEAYEHSGNGKEIYRALREETKSSTSVLTLGNHPYFACKIRFDSLDYMAEVLPPSKTIQLALACVVIPATRTMQSNVPALRLWEHNLAVGIGAELLCQTLDLEPPEWCFISGFLHDIGKMVMENCMGIEQYPILEASIEKNTPLDEVEKEMLGLDHMEVGATIAEHWKLPEPIVTAIRYHHLPHQCEPPRTLVDVVHAADALALMMGYGPQSEGMQYRISEIVESRLGIHVKAVERTIFQIHSSFDSLRDAVLELVKGEIPCQ